MIANYQPEESGESLDRATDELIASLRQSNPDLKLIGHTETIRTKSVTGKSAELIGTSPIKDEQGKALQERDWLVTVARRDGTVLYLIFISPDNDFGAIRPTFEGMLRTLAVR